MNKDKLKEVLVGLAQSFESETMKAFEHIVNNVDIDSIDDPEQFYLFVDCKWKDFVEVCVKTHVNACDDMVFLYQNYGMIESSFMKLFQDIEGSACCADKSRTVIRRILNYLKTGDEISFDYSGEYTYHLPTKIFKTHQSIMSFFKALQSLRYGNYSPYLLILKEVLDESKN